MNYNLLRFTLFLIVLASSNAFSQCPNSANIDSIDQPTCTNPTGIIYLSGLPSGSWTINSSPAGAKDELSQAAARPAAHAASRAAASESDAGRLIL